MFKINYIRDNKGIIIVSLFFIVLYSLYLDKYPHVWADESFFANPAYLLVTEGRLGTTLFFDFFNMQNFTYWHPPVYMLLLAVSFKLFGFGVVQGRLVGVFLSFLCIIFTYLLAKHLFNRQVGLLASILLGSSILFFDISRIIRMEIAVTCFILIAVYFVLVGIKGSRLVYFFLSGFFAMLAVLSHPNGLFGVLVIYLIILFSVFSKFGTIRMKVKGLFRYKGIYFYSLALILTIIPYLFYISLDFHSFLGQFLWNIGSSASNPLNNVINESMRYLGILNVFTFNSIFISSHNVFNHYFSVFSVFIIAIAAISLTMIGIHTVKNRGFSEKVLLMILLTFVSFFAFLVDNKTFLYMGIVLPYWSIFIAGIYKDLDILKTLSVKKNDKELIFNKLKVILLLIFIISNLGGITYNLYLNKDYNYKEIESEVVKYIPANSTVLGDSAYWIALQKDYKYYNYDLVMLEDPYGLFEELKPDYLIQPSFVGLPNRNISVDSDKIAYSRLLISEKFIIENCTKIVEIPKSKTIDNTPFVIYKVNYN